jgi:hypothetical protein
MPDRHDWNAWQDYEAVHSRIVQSYASFINRDELRPTVTSEAVSWEGVLHCTDGIEVHVEKQQEVRHRHGRPEVRTVWYSYHVLRRVGDHVINLFRYDNIHVQPGHPDSHHRHRFREDGSEIEPPAHVGAERWPTLGDVLEEAFACWRKLAE